MASGKAALPGPERGWVIVSGDSEIARGQDLAEAAGSRVDVVVGLPCSAVSTFAVALPSTDSGLHRSMIFAQIEKRGLAGGGAREALFDFQKIEHGPEGDAFAVSVVSEVPEELSLPTAAGYSTSAMLRPVPAGGCAVWREQGRLVLGIYAQGVPVQVQVLSGSTEIGEAAGREVGLILMSLHGDPTLQDSVPTGIELSVAGVSPEALEAFSGVLTLPVTETGGAVRAVRSPQGRDDLLPASVIRARRSRATRKRLALFGAVALIFYLVLGSWLWVHSRRTVEEVESLERQVAILDPDVERVQRLEQKWKILEPAFEKDWFPVVQLNRIASALPGSGVVVREFRTTGRAIRVKGQARDVQLVHRLLEDLQAMEGFSGYEWSMPNPEVEQNNTATFEISGEPKNAGTDV